MPCGSANATKLRAPGAVAGNARAAVAAAAAGWRPGRRAPVASRGLTHGRGLCAAPGGPGGSKSARLFSGMGPHGSVGSVGSTARTAARCGRIGLTGRLPRAWVYTTTELWGATAAGVLLCWAPDADCIGGRGRLFVVLGDTWAGERPSAAALCASEDSTGTARRGSGWGGSEEGEDGACGDRGRTSPCTRVESART